jgi:hypothetical protein
MWVNRFDSAALDRELGLGRECFSGLNTVRLWLAHEGCFNETLTWPVLLPLYYTGLNDTARVRDPGQAGGGFSRLDRGSCVEAVDIVAPRGVLRRAPGSDRVTGRLGRWRENVFA